MTVQFRSHNGVWHIASAHRQTTGQTITVTRRNGRASNVIVGALVAHDPARELPYLYAFEDVRAAQGAVAQNLTRTIEGADRLYALFERAATHSHAVAVRFALTNTQRGLRLEMAGPTSRYAGQLLALTEERTGRGRRALYGAMSRNGNFSGHVGATSIELEIFNEVATVLNRFAADPAGYAAAHGRETGNCSFCGRGLTDARSLAVGYGPICADHYGLPWGDAPAPAFDVAQGSQRQMERLADNAGRPNGFDGSDQLEDEGPQRYPNAEERAGWRNAQGEIINRTAHGIDVATGSDLDGWAAQFNVLRRRDGRTRTDEELRAAIIDQQRSMAAGVPSLEDILNAPQGLQRAAMASNRASAGFPTEARDVMGRPLEGIASDPVSAGQPVSAAAVVTQDGRVINTYRRARTAPAPAAPRPSPLQRLRERSQARAAAAREGAAAPADETTTTVVRAVRRDPNSALEEDDFVWPPQNIAT